MAVIAWEDFTAKHLRDAGGWEAPMRWLLGLFVILTAAPALAFEGEVDAKSIGNAEAGAVEFRIYVSPSAIRFPGTRVSVSCRSRLER